MNRISRRSDGRAAPDTPNERVSCSHRRMHQAFAHNQSDSCAAGRSRSPSSTLLSVWLVSSIVMLHQTVTPTIGYNQPPDWAINQPQELFTGCTYQKPITEFLPSYNQSAVWFVRSDSSEYSSIAIWNSTSGACQVLMTWTQVITSNFYPCLDQDIHTGSVYFNDQKSIYQVQVNTSSTNPAIRTVVNATSTGEIITSLVADSDLLFFGTLGTSQQFGVSVFNLTSRQYLGQFQPSEGSLLTSPLVTINHDRGGEVLAAMGLTPMFSFNLSLIRNLSLAVTYIDTPTTEIPILQAYRLTVSGNLLLLTGSVSSTAVELFNGTNSTTLILAPAFIQFNPFIDQTNERVYFASTNGILVLDLRSGLSSLLSSVGGGCTSLNAVGLDRLSSRFFLGCSAGLYSMNGNSLSTVQYRASLIDLAFLPPAGTIFGLTSSSLLILNGLDTMTVSFAQIYNLGDMYSLTVSSQYLFIMCQTGPPPYYDQCVLQVDLTTYQSLGILPGSCTSGTVQVSVTSDDSLYLSLPTSDGIGLYEYNLSYLNMTLIYEQTNGEEFIVVKLNHTIDGIVIGTTLWIMGDTYFLINITNQEVTTIDLQVYGCSPTGLEASDTQSRLFIYCGNRTSLANSNSLLVWDVSRPGTTPIVYSNLASQFSGWTVDPFSLLAYFTKDLNDEMTVVDLNRQLSYAVSVPGCNDVGYSVRQVALDRVSGVAAFSCYDGTIISISSNYRCQPGYSWISGACSPCAAGTFSGIIDQRTSPSLSFCYPCAIGSVAPQLGSASCELCPAGRYQDPTQFQTCTLCPSGWYQNLTGSTTCEICSAGTYSAEPGSSVCTLCSPGSFSLTNQSSTCQSCNRNSYSPIYGLNTTCQLCPAGQEALILGATTCTTCVLGSYSLSGDSCRTCPLGEYVPSPGLPCITCLGPSQSGLYCINGLASVKEGYWPYQIWSQEFNTMIYQTTPCPNSELCPGTQLQFLNSSLINGTDPSTLITYCQFPRENSPNNWLCGGCSAGYLAWGSTCDQCTETNIGMVFVLLAFSIILVLFLYRSGTSSAGHLAILIFFLQTSALELDSVSTYLAWLQFVNFGSNSIHTCLAPLTPLQQQLLTFSIPIILIVILGLLCGIHATIFFCHQRTKSSADDTLLQDEDLVNPMQSESFSSFAAASTDSHRGHSTSYVQMEWSRLQTIFSFFRYLGCIGSILLFCYTSVTVAIVQSLHCVEVAPGVTLLNSMPTVDCSSDEYRSFLPVVYVWLVVYVIGLPVVMGLFLFINRQRLHSPSTGSLVHPIVEPANSTGQSQDSAAIESADAADSIRDKSNIDLDKIDVYVHATTTALPSPTTPLASQSQTKTRRNYFPLCFGAFYLGFSSRCSYYWQPILLLRRFAFALVSVLLSDTDTRYSIFALLHVSTLLLHVWSQPFSSVQMNQIESGSYLILIYVSILLTSSPPPYSLGMQIILFLLVVPVGVGLIIWTLKHQMNWLKQQFNKFQRRQRLEAKAQQHTHPSAATSAHHHSHSFDQPFLDEHKDELAPSLLPQTDSTESPMISSSNDPLTTALSASAVPITASTTGDYQPLVASPSSSLTTLIGVNHDEMKSASNSATVGRSAGYGSFHSGE